jgi:Tfp pilus assembly PilM family ATPase
MLNPGRFEPPLRRVLAVDAGSRCLRLLLLESRFGRLRVLKQDAMDLHEEGLVSPEEVKAHVQAIVEDWGRPPIALALPQHVAVSQCVDLPPAPESESRKLIEDETIKLAGVSESVIVYDFVRVPLPSETRHRFWVTFCQEGEIRNRIAQLGLAGEDFREVTTAANALLTAWSVTHPHDSNAVLVHAGAQNTTVVIMLEGAGVFAASFPMGGDFFTRAIARLRNCPVEAAEALKRSDNLLEGAAKLAGFAEVVDGWATELKRQLNEWREHGRPKKAVGLSGLNLFVSGGVFDQPGLLDYLNTRAALKLNRWPTDNAPDAILPTTGFEIALGTALQALGQGTQPVSLLPAERRAGWRKRLGRQRLEFASAIVLAAVMLALVFGVWQKLSLIRHKRALQVKVDAGIESALANRALTAELLDGFDTLRPLFERQQNTTDTLETIARLQQVRSNRTFWYVLLADQQSYFSHPPTLTPTNKAKPFAEIARTRTATSTNASPAKAGFIAELCVPEEPDAGRLVFSLVVNDLKRDPTFARVDQLSEDLRRSLADPKVILPERHFALALDFATTEFQPPAQPRKPRPPVPGRATSRPTPPDTTTSGDEP